MLVGPHGISRGSPRNAPVPRAASQTGPFSTGGAGLAVDPVIDRKRRADDELASAPASKALRQAASGTSPGTEALSLSSETDSFETGPASRDAALRSLAAAGLVVGPLFGYGPRGLAGALARALSGTHDAVFGREIEQVLDEFMRAHPSFRCDGAMPPGGDAMRDLVDRMARAVGWGEGQPVLFLRPGPAGSLASGSCGDGSNFLTVGVFTDGSHFAAIENKSGSTVFEAVRQLRPTAGAGAAPGEVLAVPKLEDLVKALKSIHEVKSTRKNRCATLNNFVEWLSKHGSGTLDDFCRIGFDPGGRLEDSYRAGAVKTHASNIGPVIVEIQRLVAGRDPRDHRLHAMDIQALDAFRGRVIASGVQSHGHDWGLDGWCATLRPIAVSMRRAANLGLPDMLHPGVELDRAIAECTAGTTGEPLHRKSMQIQRALLMYRTNGMGHATPFEAWMKLARPPTFHSLATSVVTPKEIDDYVREAGLGHADAVAIGKTIDSLRADVRDPGVGPTGSS